MGTAQSTEQGGTEGHAEGLGTDEHREGLHRPPSEIMADAPAIGLGIGDAYSGSERQRDREGQSGGFSVAPHIDVAMPMDIAGGGPRHRGGQRVPEPQQNFSMHDSSFDSSFGSFMTPPDGVPRAALSVSLCLSLPVCLSPTLSLPQSHARARYADSLFTCCV